MNFIVSTFKYKCPRCRKGDIFTMPFEISKPVDMPKRCAHCNLKLEPEPGFYFGAMFISYLLTAFPLLGVGLFLAFVHDWSMSGIIGILLLVAAITFIKVLRFSRSLWIHLMVGYKPEIEPLKK
ncbi:MAG: DUF983 domain-containing protein [Saprospiraceae bacterium]